MERPPSLLQYDWNARNEAVSRLQASFDQYLALGDTENEGAAYRSLANTIISAMRLYVVRPLQRHPAMKAPDIEPLDVVRLATTTLSATLALYDDAHVWSWYAKGFNEWHPLAVLLAELAARGNTTVPEAWGVARRAYWELGKNIAEGASGPLWLQISRLMRAAEAREQADSKLSNSDVFQLDFPGNTMPLMNHFNAGSQPPEWIDAWAYWEALIDDLAGTAESS